jgi:hypothetical protein
MSTIGSVTQAAPPVRQPAVNIVKQKDADGDNDGSTTAVAKPSALLLAPPGSPGSIVNVMA